MLLYFLCLPWGLNPVFKSNKSSFFKINQALEGYVTMAQKMYFHSVENIENSIQALVFTSNMNYFIENSDYFDLLEQK